MGRRMWAYLNSEQIDLNYIRNKHETTKIYVSIQPLLISVQQNRISAQMKRGVMLFTLQFSSDDPQTRCNNLNSLPRAVRNPGALYDPSSPPQQVQSRVLRRCCILLYQKRTQTILTALQNCLNFPVLIYIYSHCHQPSSKSQ